MMVNGGMVKVKRIRLEDTKEWLVFAETDDGMDGDTLAIIKPDVKYVPDSPKLKEIVEELIQKDSEFSEEPDVILGAWKLQQFFNGKRIIGVTFIESKGDKKKTKKKAMLAYVYKGYVNEGEYHDLVIHDENTVERLLDICNKYGRRKNKMITYTIEC
jgi:hypothetical protein